MRDSTYDILWATLDHYTLLVYIFLPPFLRLCLIKNRKCM
uniref:Uncharacterized protein n=1 Tax=Rhizophora mucronata TaxID=61149 RepID=A0A2P2QHW0_RHIMU